MIDKPFIFKIARLFDAPRDRVWKAWTDAEKLQKWFGPKGCPIFQSTLDLREGGIYHYGMQTPDGGVMWGKWTFRQITPPERMVFIVSFTDEAGEKATRHPWNAGWPLEMLSTVDFLAKGEKTEVIVQWEAFNATESEAHVFKEGQTSMHEGWSGTFEQLEAYLKDPTYSSALSREKRLPS